MKLILMGSILAAGISAQAGQVKTYQIDKEFAKFSEKDVFANLWYFHGNDQIKVRTQTVDRYGTNILEALKKTAKNKNKYPPIGIVDSGLDGNISKYEGMNVIATFDVTSDDVMIDDYGHGTGIASILASEKNGKGLIGVAPGAPLMPIKVFRAVDFREEASGVDFEVLEKAIDAAASQGVRVINMSVAQSAKKWPRNKVAALFKKYEKQILFVLAAGNDGLDLDKVSPSKLPSPVGLTGKNILIVGGHDILGKRFPTSNYGSCVEVYAPGVNLTQWRLEMGESKYQMNWILKEENGTSHAAPIVSGIAAMVLRVNPQLTASQVKEVIVESAEEIKSHEIKKADALNAVNLALQKSKSSH